MKILISYSEEQTEKIGFRLGKLLNKGEIICLSGDLGVGKTAFVRGVARGLGIKENITSPTFTIVNEYEGNLKLYHFDVYRVNDPDELFEIGFEEYIYGEGVTIIEWAELINDMLPKDRLFITIRKDFSHGEDYREIELNPSGEIYINLVNQID